MDGGNITRCPYCMSPMVERPVESRLTIKQFSVYRAVVDAGPEGISHEDLLKEFFAGRSPNTLRSCVHAINQIINPQRLAGKNGRYFLDRVKWSTEDEGDGSDSG